MISFIVPAHNEESCLPRTLQAIHDAARVTGQPYEIIVVDDASTDATAEVARRHNAIVVPVNHRQIAATRNSGARAANGERLFFGQSTGCACLSPAGTGVKTKNGPVLSIDTSRDG